MSQLQATNRGHFPVCLHQACRVQSEKQQQVWKRLNPDLLTDGPPGRSWWAECPRTLLRGLDSHKYAGWLSNPRKPTVLASTSEAPRLQARLFRREDMRWGRSRGSWNPRRMVWCPCKFLLWPWWDECPADASKTRKALAWSYAHH